MSSLPEIAGALREKNSILLTAHIMPDGDSIGSLLGLGLALRKAGLCVTMFSADEVPTRFRFLHGAEHIVTGTFPDEHFDLVVTLDCSDHLRVRPIWENIKDSDIINIDHHPTNKMFGNMNFVDAKAAATGEIVFALDRKSVV